MYMTRTVFNNATPTDVRRFLLDDAYRVEWDDNTLQLDPIGSSSGSSKRKRKSAFLHSLVRFPKPMTGRVYTYARRVWPRPSDGGCFCLSKAAEHPAAPNTRAVNVEDFASAYVLRAPAPHLVAEGSGPCCEQLLVYFEGELGCDYRCWDDSGGMRCALHEHHAPFHLVHAVCINC